MLVTSTDDDDDVNMLAPGGRECLCVHFLSLHCALAAAQCIVIGPVCGFVAVFVCLIVCLWVCYHNNLKLCIDLHQTGFVGKGSDHLQMIKFWPSRAPGKGVCGGAKFFWLRLTTASAQCLRLSERFFIVTVLASSQSGCATVDPHRQRRCVRVNILNKSR